MKNNSIILSTFTGLFLMAGPARADTPDSQPLTWISDPAGTFMTISWDHSGMYRIPAIFKTVKGMARNVTSSDEASFDLTVDASQILCHDALAHGHLLSDKFFDAARFPSIHLVSKSVRKTDKGYEAVFDVTLHGITRQIPFTMQPSKIVPFEGTRFRAFTFHGEISRSAFGMTWQQPEPLEQPLYGDMFDIVLTSEFIDHPLPPPSGTAN